jgi:hypothetical protein
MLLALLLLTPLLGSCRYSFIPLIPDRVDVELPTRIAAADLKREGETLVASATLAGLFKPDYLTVVWFNGDTELGRDSIYLDAAQRGGQFKLTAPAKGSYRVMLSYGGVLLRQVDLLENGEL